MEINTKHDCEQTTVSHSHRIRWECIPGCDPWQVCIPTQEHGNKMG